MTALLSALRDVFLHPSAHPPRRRATPARAAAHAAPIDVAVLCGPDTAATAAAVLALASLRRAGAATAVVAWWDAHPAGTGAAGPPSKNAGPSATADGPATFAARRLAQRLRGRGVAAAARGRLVHLALPRDPTAAAQAVTRLAGAVDVPLVTVIAGPRPADLDALLGARDRVVVVAPPGAPDGVVELATIEAAGIARATGQLALPATIGVKLAARAGWIVPSAARAAADGALDGRAR